MNQDLHEQPLVVPGADQVFGGAHQLLTALVQKVNALQQSHVQGQLQLQQQLQQIQVALAAIQQQLQGGQPAQQQPQAQLAAQLQDLRNQVLTPAEKNQIYRRLNLGLDSSTPLMRLVNNAGEVAINHPNTKWDFERLTSDNLRDLLVFYGQPPGTLEVDRKQRLSAFLGIGQHYESKII